MSNKDTKACSFQLTNSMQPILEKQAETCQVILVGKQIS